MLLRVALDAPFAVLGVTGALFVGALVLYPSMGKKISCRHSTRAAPRFRWRARPARVLGTATHGGRRRSGCCSPFPRSKSVGRRAGRAERDDHVMPVSVNEFDGVQPGCPRREVFAEVRSRFAGLPGTFTNVGCSSIAHRLAHAQRVSAKVAVKIFGPDSMCSASKAPRWNGLPGIPAWRMCFLKNRCPSRRSALRWTEPARRPGGAAGGFEYPTLHAARGQSAGAAARGPTHDGSAPAPASRVAGCAR